MTLKWWCSILCPTHHRQHITLRLLYHLQCVVGKRKYFLLEAQWYKLAVPNGQSNNIVLLPAGGDTHVVDVCDTVVVTRQKRLTFQTPEIVFRVIRTVMVLNPWNGPLSGCCPEYVGRVKILVIHGIVIGLYYWSDRWEQPIYIIGLPEGCTPNSHYALKMIQ